MLSISLPPILSLALRQLRRELARERSALSWVLGLRPRPGRFWGDYIAARAMKRNAGAATRALHARVDKRKNRA